MASPNVSGIAPSRSNQTRFEIPVTRKASGRVITSIKIIDLSDYHIESGGLLVEALNALPRPIATSALYCFKRLLALSCNDARKILGTPAHQLAREDIERLVVLLSTVAQKAHPNEMQSYRTAIGVFLRLKSELSCGNRICDVMPKRTSEKIFQIPASTPRVLISELPDPAANDPEIQAPISALRFSTVQELEEKALDHLQSRTSRIEEACWKEIKDFLAWREDLRRLKGEKLPPDLEAKLVRDGRFPKAYGTNWFTKLPTSVKLHFNARLVERHSLHNYAAYQESAAAGARDGKLIFYGTTEIAKTYPFLDEMRCYHSLLPALLADTYLSVPVIVAACILFQIRTGWNFDTNMSLARSGIRRERDGYMVTSLKGKTDQYQSVFIRNDEQALIHLIELLLEHGANAQKHWKFLAGEENALFIGWQGTDFPLMGRVPMALPLRAFCARHSLPQFTFEQLRDQAANTDYALHRDPHRTQALLGHGSLGATTTYLNQGINRVLAEANMREFMERLAASIVWAVEGEASVTARGLKIEDIDRRLLFPIVDTHQPNTTFQPDCDAWLENQATELVITRDRIAHTVRQRHYYYTQWQRLLGENTERFEKVHLPRIILNAALCQLLEESQYASVYREIEDRIVSRGKQHA